MLIMKKVIRYKCDFCKYTRASKKQVVEHEKTFCFKNPENKSCATCEHYFPAVDVKDENGKDLFDFSIMRTVEGKTEICESSKSETYYGHFCKLKGATCMTNKCPIHKLNQ